uniref:Uncharacterized protein n=1 Tax=Romanomermis culicivorax TaxID=13658 RepID=A0A915I3E8_ROMCU
MSKFLGEVFAHTHPQDIMGNKHSDLAYAQHGPRRYPASHIGMSPPTFPTPMRRMPPGPRSEIMGPSRHRKMAPPDSIIPYGACVNGKTLKKMSKKEKKIFEAGAYSAPPIPRFAPPHPSMNGASPPFPVYGPPLPTMAHRGFGPPRMLAIMPPPTRQLPTQLPQFPMPLPQQPAFYYPRPPMTRTQAQPLQIEYHKNLATVNDNGTIVTVEADVDKSVEAEIEQVEKVDLQQNIEQKPPRLPEPNRVTENNRNQSTKLKMSQEKCRIDHEVWIASKNS